MLRLSFELRRAITTGSVLVVFFKAACIFVMTATPLFGVWIASSLAAYGNKSVAMPIAAGLLLFPGLPLGWEAWARSREKPGKRRFLTFFDRLVLRTLAINALFLTVLLGIFPQRAFVALSARGDWMLDGAHGPSAQKARRVLASMAGTLDWLYRATRDNPYKEKHEPGPGPGPSPKPGPGPQPSPPPTPKTAPPVPTTIHPVVAAMPREAETDIASVGRYIKERVPDQKERVKALHDWVADRIAYDAPAYARNDIPQADGQAEPVFASRVGVCAGYAKLLAALGKVTGDEIAYVVGDARSRLSPMEAEHHAWNAAKIDGTWYLIDATWNAGGVDGEKFEKSYGTRFLFTPPEVFVVTHFPDDPKWQLLAEPISRTEFFRRPVLDPTFFAWGLELRAPDRSQVAASGRLDVDIANPRGAYLLASYTPHGGGAKTRCESSGSARSAAEQREGDNRSKFACTFAAPGTYDVSFFVNGEEYGTYAYAGSVQVTAR